MMQLIFPGLNLLIDDGIFLFSIHILSFYHLFIDEANQIIHLSLLDKFLHRYGTELAEKFIN